jgi:hypothetical protein
MTTTKWTRIRTEHLSINARTDVSTKGKQKIMTIRSSNTIVFQLSALVFRRMKSLMPTLHSFSKIIKHLLSAQPVQDSMTTFLIYIVPPQLNPKEIYNKEYN